MTLSIENKITEQQKLIENFSERLEMYVEEKRVLERKLEMVRLEIREVNSFIHNYEMLLIGAEVALTNLKIEKAKDSL